MTYNLGVAYFDIKSNTTYIKLISSVDNTKYIINDSSKILIGRTYIIHRLESKLEPNDVTLVNKRSIKLDSDLLLKMVEISSSIIKKSLNDYNTKLRNRCNKIKTSKPTEMKIIKKLEDKVKFPDVTINKDSFYIEPETQKVLYRNIEKCINTLLIGETGSGKSEIVILLAKKMGLPCYIYDMGTIQDPISGLLGVHRIEKGESIFDYAKFVEDIQKPGIILLDELSRAPFQTNNVLFSCLDSRRELYLEIASNKGPRCVKVHPKCVFFATANIGLEYSGTNVIDKALMNRFFPVEVSYLNKSIESLLLSKRTKITNQVANNICSITKDIRDLYEKGDISTSISTRESLMIGDLIHDGWDLITAIKTVIVPIFNQDDKQIILKLIASK